MEELWINDIKVDVFEKSVSQTLQVNDLSELKDRQASYTNRIKLPMTPHNMKAFDFLGISGSQSRKPWEKPRAKYVVDGVELISEGFAVVRKSKTSSFYDVAVYSGNISMFDIIRDKTLPELNWNDLNHHLNVSTWEQSLTNTEGFIYAIGGFGYSQITNLKIERQAPSLFFRTVWDKIFTDAGFTYSGAFFDSNDSFKSELLPMSKGYTVDEVDETVDSIGSVTGATIQFNETGMANQTSYQQQYNLTGGLTGDLTVLAGGLIQSNFDGVLRVQFNTNFSRTYGSGAISLQLNGTPMGYVAVNANGSTNEIITATVSVNDTIRVVFYGTSDIIAQGEPTQAINVSASCSLAFSKITGGMFMDFAAMVADTKQSDFLKDIMQRYGLMFQSKGSNHYEFIQMETLLNDRSGAEDWTEKLSHFGAETYKLGSYAQENHAGYQYEEDIVPSHDGFFGVTNENIPRTKSLFTSIHRISEKTSLSFGGEPVYHIPIWNPIFDESNVLIEVENLVDVSRIFKLKLANTSITAFFIDPLNNTTVLDNVPILSLDEVDMDFYFNNFYPAFNRILNAPRKRADYFYLNNIDIYNLDFFKLKRIDQLGQYYYLNKVAGFKNEKVTKCELIQVNGLTFNQAPDQVGDNTFSLSHGSYVNLTLNSFVNTTPPYSDPEFDAPETIKILSFGSADVEIRNNGIPITSETIVQADNINLSIHDLGNITDAHSAQFTFKIQSFNSSGYSADTGTFFVNVSEYVNQTPIAEAGHNFTLDYDSSLTGQASTILNGSQSSDPDGDPLTFLWTLENEPNSVTLSPNILQPAFATIDVDDPNGFDNTIVFIVRLRVTDPSGAFDEDTIEITLNDTNPNPN